MNQALAAEAGGASATAWVVFIVLLLGLYFVPSIVAFARRHHNKSGILALNFFLGWTLVGWVVALVWSVSSTAVVVLSASEPQRPSAAISAEDRRACPNCAEMIRPEARVCHFCGKELPAGWANIPAATAPRLGY